MRTRTRMITVAVVVTFSLLAAGCSSSPAPPEGDRAVAELLDRTTTPWPTGTWAAALPGTDAYVAIVNGSEGAVAYVCDQGTNAQWFRADPLAGTATLTTGEATMVLTPDGDTIRGTLDDPRFGAISFDATPSGPDTLQRSFALDEEASYTAGWITLADGSQRGALTAAPRTGPTVPLPSVTAATAQPLSLPAGGRTITAPALPITPPVQLQQLNRQVSMPSANPVRPDTISTVTRNRPVDFVWAAIGDSYSSGEGAPVRGATLFSAPDWGPATADVSLAERQACHRSVKAGAPLANDALVREFPEVRFHFAHYACSGAQTTDLMQAGYDGPDRTTSVAQPAQGDRAADFAAGFVGRGRTYDALYMGIGGNDAGFGPVIAACLAPGDCSKDPINIDGDTLTSRLASLPGRFQRLDAYLHSTDRAAQPRRIFIGELPDITTGADGTSCGGFTGASTLDITGLIAPAEARWASSVVVGGMNRGIESTSSLGWNVINGHLREFVGKGYCVDADRGGMVNTNNAAVTNQGDDYGFDIPFLREGVIAAASLLTAGIGGIVTAATFKLSAGMLHPNLAGFAAYGRAISDSIRPLVAAKLAAGLQTPRRLRAASATANGDITFRWDDVSTTETTHRVTVERIDGNGRVSTGTFDAPADVASFTVPVSGRAVIRLSVVACAHDVCTDPVSTTGANFAPATPTGGRGGFIALETNDRPTQVSANASWLPVANTIRYVGQVRRLDKADATREVVVGFPVIGQSIADPDFASEGAPKGRYGFRLAACDLVGCSSFSNEVVVDARGEPKVIDLTKPLTGKTTSPIAAVLLDGTGRLKAALTGPALPGEPFPAPPTNRPGSPTTTLVR